MTLKYIEPDVLALLSALIAVDLAKGMDLEEQNVFGNFIVAVGSIILTMAAAGAAQLKAQEEAKAALEASKKGGQEESKTAKGATGQAKAGPGNTKDAGSDILIGRSEPERLISEHELLRRLRALEQRVAKLIGPDK